MREDMFKVIVERPRHGNRLKSRGGRRVRLAELPSRIGSKRFIALTERDTKSLNENLAPLHRFLAKQVGRPWSKVYSEICANLNSDNTVQQHVRDHLKDFVAFRLGVGRDGEWLDRGYWLTCSGYGWHQDFYVDPDDGILKDSAKFWRKRGVDPKPWKRQGKKAKTECDVVLINGDLKLHRVKGIWFAVTYAGPREAVEDTNVYDVIKQRPVAADERFAASKRQLCRSELKRYGLTNEDRYQGGQPPQRHKRKRKRS